MMVSVLNQVIENAKVQEYYNNLLNTGFVHEVDAVEGSDVRHLTRQLNLTDVMVLDLWEEFPQPIKDLYDLIGAKANAYTMLDAFVPHFDSLNEDEVSGIFFANAVWLPQWAGELVFIDKSGDSYQTVTPKPGRLVVFDSKTIHRHSPQTKNAPTHNYTITFKLKRKA